MKRVVKIEAIGEPRNGVSKHTGKPWTLIEIAVKWTEQEVNCQPYEQGIVITCGQDLNLDLLKSAVESGQQIQVTFYMEWTRYGERLYTNIRGYLPKSFEKNQQNQPF